MKKGKYTKKENFGNSLYLDGNSKFARQTVAKKETKVMERSVAGKIAKANEKSVKEKIYMTDDMKKIKKKSDDKNKWTCDLNMFNQTEDDNFDNKSLFLTTIWELGCVLYNLYKINLDGYPEGNVITKRSVQRRLLSGGHWYEYVYYYENVDVFGVGQLHLPVKNKGERKNPNDIRWKLRDKIMYRRQIENRRKSNLELLENAIKSIKDGWSVADHRT